MATPRSADVHDPSDDLSRRLGRATRQLNEIRDDAHFIIMRPGKTSSSLLVWPDSVPHRTSADPLAKAENALPHRTVFIEACAITSLASMSMIRSSLSANGRQYSGELSSPSTRRKRATHARLIELTYRRGFHQRRAVRSLILMLGSQIVLLPGNQFASGAVVHSSSFTSGLRQRGLPRLSTVQIGLSAASGGDHYTLLAACAQRTRKSSLRR